MPQSLRSDKRRDTGHIDVTFGVPGIISSLHPQPCLRSVIIEILGEISNIWPADIFTGDQEPTSA
jgi:hypothetical protein